MSGEVGVDGHGKERRATPRLPVFAGNAEINDIMGRRPPRERARILNWSRGGLCLRVPSPRRRFIFFAVEPVLRLDDELHCTLRLPPEYKDIEINASVVRVERSKEDKDQLDVGLRFDGAMSQAVIDAMARLLEPRPRAPSVRIAAAGGDRTSRREKKKSQRLEKKSQRLGKPSERLDRRTSGRVEKKSQRLEKRASSGRLPAPLPPPPEPERPSRRLSLVQDETIEVRRQSSRHGRI